MLCYPRKMLVSPADLGAKSENGTRGKAGTSQRNGQRQTSRTT